MTIKIFGLASLVPEATYLVNAAWNLKKITERLIPIDRFHDSKEQKFVSFMKT